MKISGATALVTGATGGIGQAIARALHEHGAKLILTGRRTEVLEPLAQELGARTLAVDLVDPSEVDRLASESGAVDILIANAALPATGTLDTFTMQEVDRALAVNLRAPIALAHAFTPGMVARHCGHVLFMSSLSGKAATPHSLMYNATKFGLRGFALGLRADLREQGVGVSVVMPGFIRDAGMFVSSGAELPSGVGTRTPEDVARASIRVIERNQAEAQVAPLTMRLGTTFASLAPDAAATMSRRFGSEKIAADMASGNSDKR